jgi:hypothetical protein
MGTGLLVLGGLSLVILLFGTGTPLSAVLPTEGWLRMMRTTKLRGG